MTAVNIGLNETSAHILTDGLVTGPDGSQVCLCSKVYPIPHLDCAVVSRGFALAGHSMAGAISLGRRSFDDAAEHLGHDVRAVHAAIGAGSIGAAAGIRWDIFLVGWSDAERRFAARLCSTGIPHMGGCATAPEPFEAISIEGIVCPGVEGWEVPEDFAPARDGLDLLRRQHAAFPGEVGGFAQLTTLRRGSVLTTMLERWPEVTPCAA